MTQPLPPCAMCPHPIGEHRLSARPPRDHHECTHDGCQCRGYEPVPSDFFPGR